MTNRKTTKIIVAGAAGRMGRAILSLAVRDPEIQIAGAFEQATHPAIGRDVGELIGHSPIKVPVHPDLRECAELGNVIIDFTSPEATAQNLAIGRSEKKAILI